jgi:general secretion pathway protein G
MIEIMLVLALIGLVMGAVVVKLRERTIEAQKLIARTQINELSAMFLRYRVGSGGDCPTVNQWLEDGTLRAEPKDPWRHPFVVTCPGTHDESGADIVSLGPDGQLGSRDDIESWRLQ